MKNGTLCTYDPIGDASTEILEWMHVNGQLKSGDVSDIIRKHLARPPAFEIHADNEGYEALSKHWAIRHLAKSLAHTFKEFGGKNYCTFEFSPTPAGPLVVTIQCKTGKSPAEIQDELIAMLRALLDRGLSDDESDKAIDNACKWLYEYDLLSAEKQPNVERYQAAQRELYEQSAPWWRRLGRRFKCNRKGNQ